MSFGVLGVRYAPTGVENGVECTLDADRQGSFSFLGTPNPLAIAELCCGQHQMYEKSWATVSFRIALHSLRHELDKSVAMLRCYQRDTIHQVWGSPKGCSPVLDLGGFESAGPFQDCPRHCEVCRFRSGASFEECHNSGATLPHRIQEEVFLVANVPKVRTRGHSGCGRNLVSGDVLESVSCEQSQCCSLDLGSYLQALSCAQ